MNSTRARSGDLVFGSLFGAAVGCGAAAAYAAFLTSLFIGLTVLALLVEMVGGIGATPLAELARDVAGLALGGAVFIVLVLIVAALVAVIVGLAPAAVLGGITGLLISVWLRAVGWRHSRRRAALTGLLISLGLAAAVGLAMAMLLLLAPGGVSDLPFPLAFAVAWFGPPVLIYLGAGGFLGWYLHRRLAGGPAAGRPLPDTPQV